MKIWLTYYDAGSLAAAGLERVEVWFAKPAWTYTARDPNADLPFTVDQSHGLITRGWRREYSEGEKFERKSISFGKVFGYLDSNSDKELQTIAVFVWEKLVEHFGDANIYNWIQIQDDGKALPQNFLLELDLSVVLRQNSLVELEKERLAWSFQTFPQATAFSSIDKLIEEANEVKKDIKEGVRNAEEYADMLMCVFDSAGRQEEPITIEEIIDVFKKKLLINKGRAWKHNPDNTYSHIKTTT